MALRTHLTKAWFARNWVHFQIRPFRKEGPSKVGQIYSHRKLSMSALDVPPTVVSAQWLQKAMGRPIDKRSHNLRVLDYSWHKPTEGRNARAEYHQSHIKGASFFDPEVCRDKESPYALMLPKPGVFEDYVGSLGIDNNCHVIVYDTNDSCGMFSSPRLWWMFKVFGHDNISVLDGGSPRWKSLGFPTTSETTRIMPKVFRSSPRPHLVKSYEDVLSNLTSKVFSLTDSRSAATYQRSDDTPHWSGTVAGHIPGAISMPYAAFVDPNTKLFKGHQEVEEVFRKHGIDLKKPFISSCGSGVTACLIVLAAHLCGVPEIPVYDGSWSEWSRRAKPEHVVTERKGSKHPDVKMKE